MSRQFGSNSSTGGAPIWGTAGAVIALAAAGFGINRCSSNQAEAKLREVTPIVSARLDYFSEQAGKLNQPADSFLTQAGTARVVADQALLNQLEKCSCALALMGSLLEHHSDPTMKADYALTSTRINYNNIPLSIEMPRGEEYLAGVRKCTDACIATFQDTARGIEESAASRLADRDALFSNAHGRLAVLAQHAGNHSLSFDEQFVVLNKFGDKQVVAVSDPYYEAEAAVGLLKAALR